MAQAKRIMPKKLHQYTKIGLWILVGALEAVLKFQFIRSWGGAGELLRYSSVAYSSEYASSSRLESHPAALPISKKAIFQTAS